MLTLDLPGVWSSRPLEDGVVHRNFLDDTQVVVRAWLAAGEDPGRMALRVLETLARSRTRWELESAGEVGSWPVRVVAGRTPDEGVYAHAVVRLPAALVSISRHEPEGDDVEAVARSCLEHVSRLDASVLTDRADAALRLQDAEVQPEALIPWVLDRGAALCGGAVPLDNGLVVAPAELRGANVRLMAPDHRFWTRWPPGAALTRAILNLAAQLSAGTLPVEHRVLRGGASFLRIGPHPAAHGALLLPDLRALARDVFGALEPAALVGGRDLLLVVPADWPEHWKEAALDSRRRRAPDLVLPGPLWTPG